jgi:hypothetical protein
MRCGGQHAGGAKKPVGVDLGRSWSKSGYGGGEQGGERRLLIRCRTKSFGPLEDSLKDVSKGWGYYNYLWLLK